jgi:LPS export ABC transporter permease LptG
MATWAPNVILGIAGIGLLLWRARSADRPLRLALPNLSRLRRTASGDDASSPAETTRAAGRRVVVVVRIPQWKLPLKGVSLLDRYVARLFARIVALAFFGLLGIFYISSFIDLSDKLFKGQTTASTLALYFYYATPQFIFYIIPLAVLIAAMVAIGILTKTSELVVMKACGMSLYRAAAPLMVCAIVASAAMFGLQEQVLAYANRRAESLKHVIRGGTPRTFDVVNRKWLVARNGDIYHYLFYDPHRRELNGLSMFHFRGKNPVIATRTYVSQARVESVSADVATWNGSSGWVRQFAANGETRAFVTFPRRALRLEPPDYFATEAPEADRMTFLQLRGYVTDLKASGFNVIPQTVALHRKLAFPFVALIMTLIAVPFATTTGRRGALYGIAAGIMLAVAYWITTNAFGALGSGGVLPPVLAAWAPNLIFGAGAVYMFLTVRT